MKICEDFFDTFDLIFLNGSQSDFVYLQIDDYPERIR